MIMAKCHGFRMGNPWHSDFPCCPVQIGRLEKVLSQRYEPVASIARQELAGIKRERSAPDE